jgi:hypothetical protein
LFYDSSTPSRVGGDKPRLVARRASRNACRGSSTFSFWEIVGATRRISSRPADPIRLRCLRVFKRSSKYEKIQHDGVEQNGN